MTVSLPRSFTTSRLTLRQSSGADFPHAFEIKSNWNVTRNLSRSSFPPDAAYMAAWFSGHEAEWNNGTAYRFAILQNNRMIGLIDISDIKNGEGDLGYWLDESAWGQGFGFEAGEGMTKFAFEQAGLHALTAGHASDNLPSGRLLTKLGFHHIGDVTIFSKPRGIEIVQRRLRLNADRWFGRAEG